MDISQLLAFCVDNRASDLHLSAGLPPMLRIDGEVQQISAPEMAHKDVHGMIYDIMNDQQRKEYEQNLETDFSFEISGLARFRVNAYTQNRGAAAVFRTIQSEGKNTPYLNQTLTGRTTHTFVAGELVYQLKK